MDWGKMTIKEVIDTHPKAVEILQNNGVGCFGCMMAHAENLEDGLKAHGLDVEAIVKELNDTY
jgi:hydrid cluster protein-associated redox disulfide domain